MESLEKSVEQYFAFNADKLPSDKIPTLKNKLISDESLYNRLRLFELKDPNRLLLISVFGGPYGIDRFLINKKLSGALKLVYSLIGYVCLVISWFVLFIDNSNGWGWFMHIVGLVAIVIWIVDICQIRKLTRRHNYELIMNLI